MEFAFWLLLIIGHLGLFDILYFHTWKCQLQERPECRREVAWHTVRHLVYAAQFLIIANFRFHGSALLLLVLVYFADVIVAWADVWEETESRRSQGGLRQGEYMMHVIISVLVGAYIISVGTAVWPDRLLPTNIVLQSPQVPKLARLYMSSMGFAAIGFFVYDAWRFIKDRPAVPEKRMN